MDNAVVDKDVIVRIKPSRVQGIAIHRKRIIVEGGKLNLGTKVRLSIKVLESCKKYEIGLAIWHPDYSAPYYNPKRYVPMNEKITFTQLPLNAMMRILDFYTQEGKAVEQIIANYPYELTIRVQAPLSYQPGFCNVRIELSFLDNQCKASVCFGVHIPEARKLFIVDW